MKTLIQLVVIALIFGGLSAAGTVFWQQRTGTPIAAASATPSAELGSKSDTTGKGQEKETNPDDADTGTESESKTDSHSEADAKLLDAVEPKKSPAPKPHGSSHGAEDQGDIPSDQGRIRFRGEAPVAVRPAYTPEGDEGGELINLLRERARAAMDREKRIAERQDAMKLIFDDLRIEQAQTIKVRQQLLKELQQARQALDTALQGVDEERSELRKELSETRKSTEEALRSAAQEQDKLKKQLEKANTPSNDDAAESGSGGSANRYPNLKKTAAMYNEIEPEKVAKIFLEDIKSKRLEHVVLIMNSMKEKKASAVLSTISETNPALAADLTDRLKRLKASPVPPPSE